MGQLKSQSKVLGEPDGDGVSVQVRVPVEADPPRVQPNTILAGVPPTGKV